MSWAGILKAIIAAKKAEAISKAMQSANEGMLDNSNTEGLGIDNMKNLISSMQGKSESTPTSDESLTKDTGSLTNGESLTKDTGSLIPVSETKSSSGDLGSVINQILGTKENQGEVNDTGIADYAKQQMDKNFKMKDAINEQALSELGLGDKIKEQNNLPLSEAKMAKFINPIDESSKDTFNNAFIDRFLKGKGRTMGEDTGNMAYVGDMLGDILRSRLGASDNTMTPKEKFEVMQMMEEYKKANPQAMDIAGTPQLGNSPLGMTSGYVQGQQGDPISQLAGRAQYQLKNRFLEETPESVDARALAKEAASKRIDNEINLEKKTGEERQGSERGLAGTKRFLAQYGRSAKELREWNPDVGKKGIEGYSIRKMGKIANALDYLPETAAFESRSQVVANQTARDIEGGRVTDKDREVYASSFANALIDPTQANSRKAAGSIIDLLDKGGNVTPVLKEFWGSGEPVINDIVIKFLDDVPELIQDITGMSKEDYEEYKDYFLKTSMGE